jgi:hypothetical protein
VHYVSELAVGFVSAGVAGADPPAVGIRRNERRKIAAAVNASTTACNAHTDPINPLGGDPYGPAGTGVGVIRNLGVPRNAVVGVGLTSASSVSGVMGGGVAVNASPLATVGVEGRVGGEVSVGLRVLVGGGVSEGGGVHVAEGVCVGVGTFVSVTASE